MQHSRLLRRFEMFEMPPNYHRRRNGTCSSIEAAHPASVPEHTFSWGMRRCYEVDTVVPFKICWKTDVPTKVTKNESSKHSASNNEFIDFSQPSVAVRNDSGNTFSNSPPILFACRRTPDASRPISAGIKMIKAAYDAK